MSPTARDLLLGDPFQRNLDLLVAAVLFVGTFVGYAIGLFSVEGGIVVLPFDATVVGVVAAGLIGYGRGALLPAWVSVFAAYLGFHAEWGLLSLSGHSLPGKLAFLFDPVSLGVFALASILVGSVAFGAGFLLRLGLDRVRGAAT
ncbi:MULTISPECIES: hypothetical protein [Halolamina]|uniref:Uncharacterized protein n=1 Tax=Halolamina pelagica TaxID=699431 RepID=A0A1I5TU25_9EURY|nr:MULTISPECIES: hypothetical protein [Halolamina]NHX37788.1 hypothetical protein [Halolamina sp. R1-12]SFP86097.1 hypothetical protein SAMN05216277_11071 [Halolamina pelagica]